MECFQRNDCFREHRPNRRDYDMYHRKGNRGVRRDRKWFRYRERMARRHVRLPSSSQTSPVWRGGCRRGYRRYYYRSKQSKDKKVMSERWKCFPFGLEDVYPMGTGEISNGWQALVGSLGFVIRGMFRGLFRFLMVGWMCWFWIG